MCKVPRTIDYGGAGGMDDPATERLVWKTAGVEGTGKPNLCVRSHCNGGEMGCSACRAPSVGRFRGFPWGKNIASWVCPLVRASADNTGESADVKPSPTQRWRRTKQSTMVCRVAVPTHFLIDRAINTTNQAKPNARNGAASLKRAGASSGANEAYGPRCTLDVHTKPVSSFEQSSLNGSHGEYTREDDILTPTQLALYQRWGLEDLIAVFPGWYRSVPNNAFGAYYVYFLQPDLGWRKPPGTVQAIYSNTSVVDTVTVDEPMDWQPILSAATRWFVYVPILGVCVTPEVDMFMGLGTPQWTSGVSRGFTTDALGMAYLRDYLDFDPVEMEFAVVSDLNGSHGEYTNSDDVRGGGRGRGRRRPVARIPSQPAAGMSSCAMKYARAIADPFSDITGACVPTFPSPDSQKVKVVTRTATVVIGTAGVGGVFLAPSAYTDRPYAACTTAQYSGNTLDMPLTEIPGDWALIYPSLPYTRAQSRASSEHGVSTRIVAMGAKIKYTGTQLDMGGEVAAFFDSNHAGVNTGVSMSEATRRPYASYEAVDRRMNLQIQTSCVNAHETTFSDSEYPYSEAATSGATDYAAIKNAACGLIMIVGKPGNTFNLELAMHVEYVGNFAAAGLTSTHTDSRGFELVQQASGQLAAATANNRTSSWTVMQRLLRDAAAEVAPIAINGARLVMRGIAANQRRALNFR